MTALPTFIDDVPKLIRRKRKFAMVAAEHPQKKEIFQRLAKVQYSDKFPEILKAFEQGNCLAYIAGKVLGCSKEWLNKLMKKDPELNAVIEHGRTLAEMWWADQGKKNLKNKKFNSHLFAYMTMNVTRWANKQSVDANVSADATVNLPQLTNEVIDKLLDASN